MKTKILPTTNSMNRSPLRRAFLLIPILLACFGLSPTAQAVNPTPDGAYAGANTAEGGSGALFSLTTGTNNTALGASALFSLTTGVQNTAVGAQALKNNTANKNTAIGFQALVNNTAASDNTAVGWRALFKNTDGGNSNTATGSQALYSNTIGFSNTADGFQALFSNTATPDLLAGNLNTATGFQALFANEIGVDNTADGARALFENGAGSDNTAIGVGALGSNIVSDENTAIGADALGANTGSSNIALGFNAGLNLTTGDNNIDIGNGGVAGESDTIRIGSLFPLITRRTFIYGISGVNEAGTGISAVYINSDGQLGTQAPPSSRRFKNEIKPMDKTSEAILALKPVTFHYKSDARGKLQFGLIAEEVAKVNPDLVVRDEKGEIYTVRYDAVNAMLLNEFLKEHRTVRELGCTVAKQETTIAGQRKDFQATIAKQEKEIQSLTASLKEQASQLQKVSAQLEVSKPAPQTVLNNQ